MNKKLLSIGLASLLLAIIIPTIASASMHLPPLSVEKYKIDAKDDTIKKVKITVDDNIPTAGAFGYGVALSSGDVKVIVTHAGVLDSEDQVDQWDPVWHNHVARLAEVSASHPCGLAIDGPAVAVVDLTFVSPGEAKIKNDKAEIKNAPYADDYTGNFGATDLTISAPLNTVASFTLNPVNADGETDLDFVAVCVENASFFSDASADIKFKGEP